MKETDEYGRIVTMADPSSSTISIFRVRDRRFQQNIPRSAPRTTSSDRHGKPEFRTACHTRLEDRGLSIHRPAEIPAHKNPLQI